MARRAIRIALDRGGLLGLAVLALYVWLAPAHVVDGDNAEFATLGALGGTAHPSGYPLYVLWLRATSWLPGASAAHSAAIATAILGAAAIVMLHAACRAWGARPLAATIACAMFAGAPVVLAMSTEAEVFALNGLVVATVLWLAAANGPLRGVRRAAVLGLVAGLGLSNNLTCALIAPIGILGVVRGAREAGGRAIAAAAGGVVVGMLPYAYLFVAPDHAGAWGNGHTLGDVVALFLRRDYGGPSTFASDGPRVTVTENLGALIGTVGRTWWWLPALAGLGALGWACVRAPAVGDAREPRASWLALAASFVIAGPLLVTRFNVDLGGPGRYVVDRFHLLPALLLAIPIAIAIDRAATLARGRLAILSNDAVAAAITLVGLAATAGPALPHILHVHSPAVEVQVRHMLKTLPPNAVVFGMDDDLNATTHYVQLVLGERRDVTYVQVPLLGLPWYRARLAAAGLPNLGSINDALATGRPVFTQATRELFAKFPHYRYGILVAVVPRGTPAPTIDQVVAINKTVFEQLVLDYEAPGPDDEWATVAHRRYAQTWTVLADELAASGEADEATRAREIAGELGPTP